MKNKDNIKKDVSEFINGFKDMFNDLKTKGRRHKQVPNLITLSRLIFAFFIPPLALTGNLIPATILTVIAALTDGVDGLAARKLNATSEFGKNLDPVCDKVFAGVLLLGLVTKLTPLSSLGLFANLALELGISGVNLKSKAKGNIPRTTILGKFKTGMLSILIASLYASFSYQAINLMIPIIYALTTTTQALTLINYYQIDRRKDLKKEEGPHDVPFTTETPGTEEKQKTNQHENTTSYCAEDYHRLREEVIRTRLVGPPEEIEDFQKTK